MDLIQSRIVTDDVARLAAFYASLVQAEAVLNDYYVEVPTGAMSVGFSRRHFTEYRENQTACSGCPQHRAVIILDFRAGDVDAEYGRIAGLGVDWVIPPTTQPWGSRTMIFKDPEGKPHQRLLTRPGRPRLTHLAFRAPVRRIASAPAIHQRRGHTRSRRQSATPCR